MGYTAQHWGTQFADRRFGQGDKTAKEVNERRLIRAAARLKDVAALDAMLDDDADVKKNPKLRAEIRAKMQELDPRLRD